MMFPRKLLWMSLSLIFVELKAFLCDSEDRKLLHLYIKGMKFLDRTFGVIHDIFHQEKLTL